jgi:hypothetical protein
MSVLLIFIDGIGIGTRDERNPFYTLSEESRLPLGYFIDEVPPRLPHTVALLRRMRVSASKVVHRVRADRRRFSRALMSSIARLSQDRFSKRTNARASPRAFDLLATHKPESRLLAFANAYSPFFFTQRQRWLAATTVAVEAARLPFRTLTELRDGHALYHDWSNRILIERGEDAPRRSPAEAAMILARLAAQHQFTLYEFFLTDTVGHKQDMDVAKRTITELNAFLRAVLERVNLQEMTVIVTSDHGNVEDLSVRNHTRNFVPTIVWGKERDAVCAHINSIADITPAILRALTSGRL